MRIVGGTFRGTRLAEVGKGDKTAHLRPTSDRVRESLFSILTHQDVIQDARVLDLFAGTGALGLEALSRGAHSVCFVEKGRVSQRLIKENVAKLRVEQHTTLVSVDALRLGDNRYEPFDLVFLDPPYGKGFGKTALEHASKGNWLSPQATVVWEESSAQEPPAGFALTDHRRFGDTHVTFLKFR